MAEAPLPSPLPVGTRVVARRELREGARLLHAPGAVGVVVGMPSTEGGPYPVRFPGEHVVRLSRDDFEVLRRYGDAALGPDIDPSALWRHLALVVVVGSHAYGLAEERSDVDRRGFYLPPADLHWSLAGVPEQLEDREHDVVA